MPHQFYSVFFFFFFLSVLLENAAVVEREASPLYLPFILINGLLSM